MNIVKKFRKIFTMPDDLLKAKIYAQEARSNVDINTKWVEELEKKLKTLQLQYEILDNLLQEHLNKSEKGEHGDE